MATTLNGSPCNLFISGSPKEVLPVNHMASARATPGAHAPYMRTWDQDAIVNTILDAKKTVSLSVMDFIPNSLYDYEDSDDKAQPLWWPAFTDAMLTAATTKNVHVRLLISRWAHTSPRIVPYLAALQNMASVCAIDAGDYNKACNGTLEVKLFEVPGWNRPLAVMHCGRPTHVSTTQNIS